MDLKYFYHYFTGRRLWTTPDPQLKDKENSDLTVWIYNEFWDHSMILQNQHNWPNRQQGGNVWRPSENISPESSGHKGVHLKLCISSPQLNRGSESNTESSDGSAICQMGWKPKEAPIYDLANISQRLQWRTQGVSGTPPRRSCF